MSERVKVDRISVGPEPEPRLNPEPAPKPAPVADSVGDSCLSAAAYEYTEYKKPVSHHWVYSYSGYNSLLTTKQFALWQAICRKDADTVRALLDENKYLLDWWSHTVGSSFLHVAIVDGDPGVTEVLLEYGLEVDVQDINGWTPLAYGRAYVAVAEALLHHGANPNHRIPNRLKENQGQEDKYETVFQLVVQMILQTDRQQDFYEAPESAASDLRFLRLMLEHEADVSLADSDGMTPLMLARKTKGMFGRDLVALFEEFGATK